MKGEKTKLRPTLLRISGDIEPPSDVVIIGFTALRKKNGIYEWWLVPLPGDAEVKVKLEGGVDRETIKEILRRILKALEEEGE